MALQLLPLEDKDAKTFYRIIEAAESDGLFARNYWLNGVTEAGLQHSANFAIADMHEPDGAARFMKVVDPNLPDDDPMDKILSVAQWKIYPRVRSPEEIKAEQEKNKARGVPPGANTAFLEAISGLFGAAKKEIIGDQAHVHLCILCTRHEASRRGAGGIHVAWGLDQADKLGLPAYLTASPMGRPLYQRMGFQPVREVPIDKERWGFPLDQVVMCMLRPGQTQVATTV